MYVDTPIPNPEANIDEEKRFVISLDQGTTSSRSIVFDHQGQIVGLAQHEFTQIFPRAGWVEHDAKEILSTQLGTLAEVLTMEGISFSQVAAIGITNQRETTVVWDKETGEPVYNAIVWQCRRGAPLIDELIAQGKSEMIQAKTGLIPDAYYSASKVAWILDKVEGARQAAEEGKLLFGTIDTWLIWNLTQGKVHATDYTNASRTMLYNIHDFCWDAELLDLFNIPASMLPEVRPSTGDFGRCTFMGGEPGIPITGVAGDQQSSLFGQCCFQAGQAKNTYGTGCFLLMNTGDKAVTSSHGLVTTLAADPSGKPVYALEGSVFVAGALIQWLRDGLKIIDSAAESEEIAKSVDSTEGVYIVPAFTGLGAPYWDQDARGTIVGLTRGTERAHLVRAALEALAYQVQGVVDAMEQDAGIDLSALHVDGGASANDFLMQFQSNILDAEILRPQVLETTGLGAAYLAGLAVGFWKDVDELKANHAIGARFRPDMEDETRQALLAGWEDAVARTRSNL